MVGFSRHRTTTGVELLGSIAKEREFCVITAIKRKLAIFLIFL
jgi:hypothetical protein